MYSFLSDIVYEVKQNFIIHQLCLCTLLQSMDFELESDLVKPFMKIYLNM